MINTILGSKTDISQTFVNGLRIPSTKVTAGPCVVTGIKNMDADGYWAIQLGFSTRTLKNTSKALQGHLKESTNKQINKSTNKEELRMPKYIREIRTKSEPESVTGQTIKVGDVITVSDIFSVGDLISVSGISKGKGFAGVVKRHHFRGGPKTHGQSDRERAPGSIGQTTTPGRVYKGKRMAGRMGGETVTIKNVHVIGIDKEKNEMLISSPIPGIPGAILTIIKLASGSLTDLEHEVDAVVIEEAPAEPAEAVVSAGKEAAPKADTETSSASQ